MKNRILLFVVLCTGCLAAKSQVSIVGPSCVVAGVQYQYIISTPDTSGNGIHICVSGGAFNMGDSCLNDTLVSAIYVTWHEGASNLSVSFNSPAGSATNTIQLTTALQAGTIDSAYAEQTINYNGTIPAISCTAATGGSCSPSYSYQWQQSADNITWINIDNATNMDFDASLSVTQTTYLRRKVIGTTSHSIGYSNIASMYVVTPPSNTDTTGIVNRQAYETNTGSFSKKNIAADVVMMSRDIKESPINSL